MKNDITTDLIRQNIIEYIEYPQYKLPFEYYYGYAILDKKYIARTDLCVLIIFFNNKKWVCSFPMSDDPFLEAVEMYFELPNIETKSFQL